MTPRGGRREMRLAAVNHALFAVVPILVTGWLVDRVIADGFTAVDFRQAYWVAGHRVLHGISPYVWSHAQIIGGEAFVYPAPAALLFAPLALLPVTASELVFTAVCLASVVATLRVLEVQDWRLYGVAVIWSPVVAGWQTANLTLLLGLGLACVWRLRERPIAAGILAAVTVSLKPFMWPVALWLLATRRYRACVAGVVAGIVVNAIAWSIVGFSQIHRYLHISDQVTAALYRGGYSIVALVVHVGLGQAAGIGVAIAGSVSLALAVLLLGHRSRDRASLALAVGLILAASPLVWNHYFAFLLIPLAIARPRLGWVWILPLILWLCPSDHVASWQNALGLAVAGVCLFVAARDQTVAPRPAPGEPSAPAPHRQAEPAIATPTW